MGRGRLGTLLNYSKLQHSHTQRHIASNDEFSMTSQEEQRALNIVPTILHRLF